MTLLLALAAFAAEPPNLHVGDAALLFSLPALNEEAALRAVSRPHVALADFTGVLPGFPAKVVVVHFLQKSGGDAQLASLNRLQKKYSRNGARFVAIIPDGGDLATLSDWIQGQGLDFPVLNDAHGIVVSRYGVRTFPMTFIVDEAGYISAIGVPKDDLEASVESQIAPFLK